MVVLRPALLPVAEHSGRKVDDRLTVRLVPKPVFRCPYGSLAKQKKPSVIY